MNVLPYREGTTIVLDAEGQTRQAASAVLPDPSLAFFRGVRFEKGCDHEFYGQRFELRLEDGQLVAVALEHTGAQLVERVSFPRCRPRHGAEHAIRYGAYLHFGTGFCDPLRIPAKNRCSNQRYFWGQSTNGKCVVCGQPSHDGAADVWMALGGYDRFGSQEMYIGAKPYVIKHEDGRFGIIQPDDRCVPFMEKDNPAFFRDYRLLDDQDESIVDKLRPLHVPFPFQSFVLTHGKRTWEVHWTRFHLVIRTLS